MEMIKLPRVRMAQLQTLTEGVIQLTENLGEVAAQVQTVKTNFTNFKEGMIKNAAASNKKMLDRTRDRMIAGFFKSMDSEEVYPHTEPPVKTTLEKAVAVVDKYRYELNRMTYDEQTSETDNLLKELETIDLNILPAVQRWIVPMKTANDNFKQTVKSYLEEQTEASDTSAASAAAIPLEDALNALFTLLFAHVHVSKSETLIKAYKELITLVDSYR